MEDGASSNEGTLDIYPRRGSLKMDGLFGGAKPRVLSVLMPATFFVLFATLFVWIIVGYLSVAN